MDNHQYQALMNCSVNGLNVDTSQIQSFNMINSAQNALYSYTTSAPTQTVTLWNYWQDYHYPEVIHHHYPVYLQERAMDKGAKAFEILKMLQDKKLIEFPKVKDFIEAMDALIKVL